MNLLLTVTVFVSMCGIIKSAFDQYGSSSKIQSALPKINADRKKGFAKAGLPEPPDLTWDSQLVSIAKTASSNCNGRKGEPNYRVFMTGGNDNAVKNEDYNEKVMEESVKNADRRGSQLLTLQNYFYSSTTILQLMNPAQASVGCHDNPCTGQVSSEVARKAGMSGNTYEYKVFCVVGPKGGWSDDVIEKVLDDIEEDKNRGNSGSATQSSNMGGRNPNRGSQDSNLVAPKKSDAPESTDAQKSSRFDSPTSALLAFLMLPIINIFL